MQARRIFGWSIIIIAALLAVAAVSAFIYFGPIRNADGRSYIASVQQSARPLGTECRAIAAQTDKLLVDSVSGPFPSVQSTTETLRSHIPKVRTALEEYESVVHRFRPGFSLFTAADYHNAIVVHKQAVADISQIRQTLDEYDKLLTFLVEIKKLDQPLADSLDTFNKQTDLNLLAGMSDQLHATAATIRHQAALTEALQELQGFAEIKAKIVTTHKDAADGFDALAVGLFPPIDNEIYGAAAKIEVATREHDEALQLLEETLPKHPVLKDISDLPEKVLGL